MNYAFVSSVYVDLDLLKPHGNARPRCPACVSELAWRNPVSSPGMVDCMSCGRLYLCPHTFTQSMPWPGGHELEFCFTCGGARSRKHSEIHPGGWVWLADLVKERRHVEEDLNGKV